jgi:hypothetical protein
MLWLVHIGNSTSKSKRLATTPNSRNAVQCAGVVPANTLIMRTSLRVKHKFGAALEVPETPRPSRPPKKGLLYIVPV